MQNNHTKYNNIVSRKWILALALFFLTFVLFPLEAQEKLKVEGDLIIKSSDSGSPRVGLIARPQQAEPSSAQEGEIYYDDYMDRNKFRWFDGAGWSTLCSGEEYVATLIVSAYNSLGATRDGTNPCLGDGNYCNNPKADYTCDGTDDQEVINEAISKLPGSKGAVYLLEGTYNISAEVSVTSNSALIGTGKGTVLKVADDNATFLRVIYCAGTGALISQLTIDGDRDNHSNAIPGIALRYAEYCKIDKVWVERMRGGGIHIGPPEGEWGGESNHNIILNSHIRQNYNYGIEIRESDYNIVSNNNVENSDWGIFLDSAEGSIVSHNSVRNNNDVGIVVEGHSRSNIILGNNVQGNGWMAGIRIFPAAYPAPNDLGHHIICGNNVQGNGGTGISVASTHNIISGNIVCDNGSVGEPPLSSPGISTSGHGNVISSNRINDSVGESYGIYQGVINNSDDAVTYILGNLINGPAYIGSGYDRRIYDPQVSQVDWPGLISNTKYMDKTKITLERVVVAPTNGSTLEVSTSPKAYVALNPQWSAVTLSATTAISDGKTAGDMLILEGRSNTYTVTVPNCANTVLGTGVACPNPSNRILGEDDILSLIWNGADWVEIGWANN